MSKSADKRNTPEVSTTEPKNGLPGRRAFATSRSGSAASPAEAGPSQMTSFEEGMRLFHARQFQQAKVCFDSAVRGPDRAVAHRAGLHARMCESRFEQPAVVLNNPEEHYNYAITLINSRALAEAKKHLRLALDGAPDGDHVLYAMAACQSLAGELPEAYENLKRAIDLQPRNRLAARQDPDFAALAEHPSFSRLLYPDKKF